LAYPDRIPQSFRRPEDSEELAAVDFVAGMTDRFALNLYDRLFLPRGWNPRSTN
jgi:dGTPase